MISRLSALGVPVPTEIILNGSRLTADGASDPGSPLKAKRPTLKDYFLSPSPTILKQLSIRGVRCRMHPSVICI